MGHLRRRAQAEGNSCQQAIEIARKHRDQLAKGVEVLDAFPANAGDAEYQELQQKLDPVAPDVSNLGWGHKYFSLLPDKLDDYHSPDLQRFHLLKMLQLPPESDGRYVCAGRFVEAGVIQIWCSIISTAF